MREHTWMQEEPVKKPNKNKGLYEDCEFYRVLKENGKGFRTISVYKGLFYQADQTPQQRLRYRLRFSAYLILLFALFCLSCAQRSGANLTWYGGVTEGMTLVGLVYIAVVWLIYLTAEQEMRAYLYRMTSKRLIRACEIAMILAGVSAAAVLLYLPLSGFQNLLSTALTALGLAMCSLGARFLAEQEAAIPYRSWQSEEQPPQFGEKLDYKTDE
jgi:hypothetical protein